MPRLAALSFALGATMVLCASRRAEAYVQFRTPDGDGWSWHGTNCMPIVAFTQGFDDMTVNEVTSAATGAAAAWSTRQHPCTYLTLTMQMSAQPTPTVIPRRLTSLVFREGQWCKLTNSGACSDDPADLAVYDMTVLMLTSSEVSNRSGAMTRAAIEVNALDFTWTDLIVHPEKGGGTTQDLQNALTHELGHFIGLDHNCASPGTDPARMLDQHGQPAPFCDTASPELMEATMYPTAPQGDLQKRTLAADDLTALCDIYPTERDPGVCAPPWVQEEGCGCATGGGGGGSATALELLGGLALLVRRRRRRAALRPGDTAR
jgi:MYXO-CTERM domain-containing protein